MKRIILIGGLLLAVKTLYCQQVIFYLAQDLREEFSPVLKKIPLDANTKSALEKEVYKGVTVTVAVLDANPFLTGLFVEAQGSGVSGLGSKTFKSLGAIDVTKFVNAIADI